ncbi:MAG: class II aldolase/adducin family protein [Pseudomonadota bacterium]
MNLDNEKKLIVDICRRLYDRDHIVSRSGNVSCRIDDDKILITPSRLRKCSIKPNDLCVINLEGKQLSGAFLPSSEYRVHLAIYKKRPDVMAVVHTHSPFSIVCSLTTISFEYPILPETALSLGSIPTIPYAPPGSEDLVKKVEPFIEGHNAFILQRHGVVALGADLEEAFDRLEEVEHAAKIAYFVSLKGRIPRLGRSQLMNVASFAKRQGFPVPDLVMKWLHQILAK